MTYSPLVSIITPYYNVEEYIAELIESLIFQSYKNLEFIFIDDFSSDNSLNILNEYKKKDDRIIILKNRTKGANPARQYGVEISKGDYVLFSDADDRWDLNAVKIMTDIAIINSADVVACNILRFELDKKKAPYLLLKYNFNEIFTISLKENPKEFINISSNLVAKLIRKKSIENLEFENVSFAQDWNVTYKILLTTDLVVLVNKGLYHYYERSESQSLYKNSSHIETLKAGEQSFLGILKYYDKIDEKVFDKELGYLGLLFYLNLLVRSYSFSNFTQRWQFHLYVKEGISKSKLINFNNPYLEQENYPKKLAPYLLRIFLLSELFRLCNRVT